MNSGSKKRKTNLEIADAMFKEAFSVKKMRFSRENPGLSEAELKQMTALYFRNLPDDEGRRGQI